MSSCQNATVIKPVRSGNSLEMNADINMPEINQNSLMEKKSLNVNRLYVVAYVVGKVNNVSGLLRFELGTDGNWQGPQLLSENVNQMAVDFGYVVDCGVSSSAKSAKQGTFDLNNTYDFSDSLLQQQLPAVLRVKLNYDSNLSNDRGRTQKEEYIINATIRSGNICNNNLI